MMKVGTATRYDINATARIISSIEGQLERAKNKIQRLNQEMKES